MWISCPARWSAWVPLRCIQGARKAAASCVASVWTATIISWSKPIPALRLSGIYCPSGQMPVKRKTSFSTSFRPSLTRRLRWICCASVLTVKASKKQPIRRKTRTARM
ncbi:hypothetical protein HOS07_gp27 [Cronobacter phage ESSI-2]|uniref:Uncharacterized protein n=1 Tax=Cronobacter phage ESSI-2 TaxID=947842 RepID=F1BUM3_9CAUD|nr:hypothetical protein HOS07_gp27 [Cronobacter phage ESSI-2]ADX32402.1 hypothetical protein [Cronobacter phage ESSI-2]